MPETSAVFETPPTVVSVDGVVVVADGDGDLTLPLCDSESGNTSGLIPTNGLGDSVGTCNVGSTGVPVLIALGDTDGTAVRTSPNCCVKTDEVGPRVPGCDSGGAVTNGLLPIGNVGASIGMADPTGTSAGPRGVAVSCSGRMEEGEGGFIDGSVDGDSVATRASTGLFSFNVGLAVGLEVVVVALIKATCVSVHIFSRYAFCAGPVEANCAGEAPVTFKLVEGAVNAASVLKLVCSSKGRAVNATVAY